MIIHTQITYQQKTCELFIFKSHPRKRRVNYTIFKSHPSKHLHNICTTMNYEAGLMAINMRCTLDVVMTTQVLKKHLFCRIKLSTAVNMIIILFLHTRSCQKYISICLYTSGHIELKRVNHTYSNHIPADTKHFHNICTTSAQRLRRWSNIVHMSYKCAGLTGILPNSF